MTLQSSGTITSAQVLAELGQGSSFVMPDAITRWLADRPSGDLTLGTHFYGKSSIKTTDSASSSANTSTYTFNSMSIGAAFTGRVIIVGAQVWNNAGTNVGNLSVTLGGDAMALQGGQSVVAAPGTGLFRTRGGLWTLALNSGTSATIVVSSIANGDGASIQVLAVSGISATAFDTGGAGGTTSFSLVSPANGAIIAVGGGASGIQSVGGLTARGQGTFWNNRQSSGTKNLSLSSSTNQPGVVRAASFAQ